MSTTIRLFFTKQDRAKYISHLDITRVFARAIARTPLPVWYTEGFNPRIYMTFPLPIPLGYESLCESLDLRLIDDGFPLERVTQELNHVLPQGIRITETALPQTKPDEIALAEYTIKIESDEPPKLLEQLEQFVAKDSIVVVKKTKKGEKELDIKPLFTLISAEAGESTVLLTLRLAAGTTLNVSPTLFADALFAHTGDSKRYYSVERRAILTAAGQPWR